MRAPRCAAASRASLHVCVQSRLAALQTQHPGWYYEQAAEHARARRDLQQRIRAAVRDTPLPATARALLATPPTHYGRRAWRAPGEQPALDELAESHARLALTRSMRGRARPTAA